MTRAVKHSYVDDMVNEGGGLSDKVADELNVE